MSARWREALVAGTPLAVVGTAVCCALPAILVALGAGSVVASLIASAPWLVTLSRNKEWVFLAAGVLLGADYWILYRSRSAACRPGGACHRAHPLGRWLRRLFWSSVGLYVVASAAAYLLLPAAKLLGY